MSPKRRTEQEEMDAGASSAQRQGAEGESARGHLAETASTMVRDVRRRLDVDAWMDRATEVMHERPALTLSVAVGAGVILGATAFSRLGRLVLIGAIGVTAEVLMQRARLAAMNGGGHPDD
jgi:hypothetical protein